MVVTIVATTMFSNIVTLKWLSIKLNENKILKFLNSNPNKKSKSSHNKLEYRTIVLLSIGIFFLGLSVFTFMNFTMSSEKSDSKISEKNDSIVPMPSDSPQIIQNNERFGNAVSIMPDQIQPSIEEPVLENYDDVQKPLK